MNKRELKEIATSITTITFIVIGLSGVCLYFDIFKGVMKNLHEVLGLAFVVVAVLHVYVNWNAMKSYFTKNRFYVSTIVVTIISAMFIFNDATKTEIHPKSLLMKNISTANLKDALNVMNVDYENAKTKVAKKYNKNLDDYTSATHLGKEIGQNPWETLITLVNM